MCNFYKDNDDIRFLFEHMDVDKVSRLQEEDYKHAGQFDTAPED